MSLHQMAGAITSPGGLVIKSSLGKSRGSRGFAPGTAQVHTSSSLRTQCRGYRKGISLALPTGAELRLTC